MNRYDKIVLLHKRAFAPSGEIGDNSEQYVPIVCPYGMVTMGDTCIPDPNRNLTPGVEWQDYVKNNPIEGVVDTYQYGVPSALQDVYTDEELGLKSGDRRSVEDGIPKQLQGLYSDEELNPEPYGEGPVITPVVRKNAPQKKLPSESKPQAYVGGGLRKGSKGEAVKSLQVKLLEKGYFLNSQRAGSANGIFGKGTENAVLYFQVLNEIHPPNGVVDSRVLAKINSGSFIGPNDTKEPYPDAEKLEYTKRDVDAIARGLVVETGFRSSYREMANIIWIMINRSRRWNMPLYKVIDPDTGGGKNWYGRLSETNRKRWANAHVNKGRFEYIKQFIRQVLDGVSFKNEIGNKAHFLHPGGMPKCDGEPGSPCGKGRVCVDTGKWGKRCLPKWNIDGNKNMAGKVKVQTIGRARFS